MNPEHKAEGVHKVPDFMEKNPSRLHRWISAYFLIQTVMTGGKVSGYQMAFANNPFNEDEQNGSNNRMTFYNPPRMMPFLISLMYDVKR